MGFLKGSSVYLIGSVDHAVDPVGWRRRITKDLLNPMGIKVYDPLVKPSWFSHGCLTEDSLSEISFLKKYLRDPDNTFLKDCKVDKEMHRCLIGNRMQQIRKLCLRMASNADFIIGSLPKKFTVGTFEEISVAVNAGKPILLHLPDGQDVSTWLPAQLKTDLNSYFQSTFRTMDDLYRHLRLIDSGDTQVDNFEWIFLSYFHDEDVKNEFANCQ